MLFRHTLVKAFPIVNMKQETLAVREHFKEKKYIEKIKINMKNALCSLIFFVLTFIAAGQGLDTNLMTLNAKIKLLEHIDLVHNSEQVCIFLSEPIAYKLLQSKGFANNIVFFEIHLDWGMFNEFFINDNFIFAFNSKSEEIFRLKGFESNDFAAFFSTLKFDNIDHSLANEDDLKTSKRFAKAFSVEGLDLRCLLNQKK